MKTFLRVWMAPVFFLSFQTAQAQLSPGSKGSIKLDVEVQDELGIDTVSQIVELKHIRASEIQPFVQARLSKWGAVQVNDALNMVIITDKRLKLNDLVALVQKMDSPRLKDFLRLETVSISLNYTTPSSVRDLVSGQLSPEGRLVVDSAHNALVVTDLRSKIDSIKAIVEKLDVFVPQVVIEAAIVEISNDYMRKTGIDWNSLRNIGGSVQGNWSGTSGVNFINPINDSDWYASASLDMNRFFDVVNLLSSQSKARILTSTKIVTANNQSGNISAGERVNYHPVGGGENSQAGGLSVNVVPRIGAQDVVTLSVDASIDNLTGWSENGYPIFENRSARSQVAVKEGETFILGGLESNVMVETDNGIPLLKDILPFIFSSRGKKTIKSQVLILLTPHIMRQLGQSGAQDAKEYKRLKDEVGLEPPSVPVDEGKPKP